MLFLVYKNIYIIFIIFRNKEFIISNIDFFLRNLKYMYDFYNFRVIIVTTRRNILGLLAVSPFLLKSINNKFLANDNIIKGNSSSNNSNNPINSDIIIPKPLKEGAKIGITAPASPASPWEINEAVRFFKSIDCTAEVGNSVKKHNKDYKYLAASDDDRAAEFMSFIENPEIDAIMCARGGYGTLRILDKLDYGKIRKNPKIIIGFSDITALIIAINKKTGLIGFHGPVAGSSFNQFTRECFRNVLFKEGFVYTHKIPKMNIVKNGIACGKLVGGNLTMVTSTLGSEYEIDTNEGILFLEETREEPYKIDRMLSQLHLAGKFKNIKAVILGNFGALDAKKNFYPGKSFTVRQVLEDRFSKMNIPFLINMPFGHIKDKMTIPYGINAKLDTKAGTLEFLGNKIS